ncbi:MAG: NAD-dependent epimerase/dehydratase family protein [Marinibacterium sp.]
MRILVTGATGFVGSHSLAALAKRNDGEIIAACRDPGKLPSWFKGDVRQGDLRDPAYVEAVTRGVDVIVHAAAWTALFGHGAQSDALYLAPSLALFEAARRNRVARLVFVSSASVAKPEKARDPFSPGVIRKYWPHEANVVRLENHLRGMAGPEFGVVNLRYGLFVGDRFGLGLLPILVPRLKTHLVPWVAGGRTSMPLIDGRDIGACAALAATKAGLDPYESFNVTGPDVPTVRDVLRYLNRRHGLAMPHFSVPFPAAFVFAWLMETLDPLVPWDPLVTRSIVHLLQETHLTSIRAQDRLGYCPQHGWKEAIDRQMAEMARQSGPPMRMARPVPDMG